MTGGTAGDKTMNPRLWQIAVFWMLYFIFVYLVAGRKKREAPSGPPGSTEWIRYHATQEEEAIDEAKLRTEEAKENVQQ